MGPGAILHGDATRQTLGFLRIWVFGAWFVDVAKDSITDLAALPLTSFRPPGALRLVPASVWEWLVTPDGLRSLSALLLIGLALSAAGVRPYRPIAIVTCVLLTIFQGLILGFTYMAHATLAAFPVCYVLAVFPSADALALRRDTGQRASRETAVFGMMMATFVFLATYAFIGAQRIQAGGLEIFTDQTLLEYIARNSLHHGFLDGSWGLAAIETPWIAYGLLVGFPIVTAFELLSPLCLVHRGFRWAWLVVILSFHVLTWPLMQLLFVHNIVLVAALVLCVDRLVLPRHSEQTQEASPYRSA